MQVIFFGTPEFAVPSLEALLGEGFDVRAVITRPDSAQGRSRSRRVPSPVKLAAQAEDLRVYEPERPSAPAFLEQLRALTPRPDIGVVVAYGHILKPELLAIPTRGMVNVHPSLLPALRGAAPVEWAILNGLDKTGVTIMQMGPGLDDGPIIHQIPHSIPDDATGGELSAHLAELGAQALVECLGLLEQDLLKPVPQKHELATYAPKLTRELARIDWTKSAADVARVTRALDPRPGAWAALEGQDVKLFEASAVDGRGAAGEVLVADGRLVIATGGGAIQVDEVQPQGKARMPAADWIRGRGVRTGQRFS